MDLEQLLAAAEKRKAELVGQLGERDRTIEGLNARVADLEKKSPTDDQVARLRALAS